MVPLALVDYKERGFCLEVNVSSKVLEVLFSSLVETVLVKRVSNLRILLFKVLMEIFLCKPILSNISMSESKDC